VRNKLGLLLMMALVGVPRADVTVPSKRPQRPAEYRLPWPAVLPCATFERIRIDGSRQYQDRSPQRYILGSSTQARLIFDLSPAAGEFVVGEDNTLVDQIVTRLDRLQVLKFSPHRDSISVALDCPRAKDNVWRRILWFCDEEPVCRVSSHYQPAKGVVAGPFLTRGRRECGDRVNQRPLTLPDEQLVRDLAADAAIYVREACRDGRCSAHAAAAGRELAAVAAAAKIAIARETPSAGYVRAFTYDTARERGHVVCHDGADCEITFLLPRDRRLIYQSADCWRHVQELHFEDWPEGDGMIGGTVDNPEYQVYLGGSVLAQRPR
jgi:hypothetical protein